MCDCHSCVSLSFVFRAIICNVWIKTNRTEQKHLICENMRVRSHQSYKWHVLNEKPVNQPTLFLILPAIVQLLTVLKQPFFHHYNYLSQFTPRRNYLLLPVFSLLISIRIFARALATKFIVLFLVLNIIQSSIRYLIFNRTIYRKCSRGPKRTIACSLSPCICWHICYNQMYNKLNVSFPFAMICDVCWFTDGFFSRLISINKR